MKSTRTKNVFYRRSSPTAELVPWVLEIERIDGKMVIVNEYEKVLKHVEDPESFEAHAKFMRNAGVSIDSKGSVTSALPPAVQDAFKFFTDEPCWFDGCEDLRKELLEKHGDGASCKGCARGSVIRSMIPRVHAAILKHNEQQAV